MSNTYLTSSGERVKKSVIDRKVREAKEYKLDLFHAEHGYYFCEDCKRSDVFPIDCSHNVSVSDCQKQGKSELAWDIDNIKLRCRKCHQKRDGLNLQFK